MNIREVISQPLRPGLDAFSLRHQGWTAERLLRFFHENSIVRAMVSLAQAEELVETVGEDRLDLQLSVALGPVICDTAAITDPNAARDARLALSDRLRRANAVGANVARVSLLPMGRSSRVEGVEPFEAAFQILERALSTFRYDGLVAVENHRDLLAADLANLITRSYDSQIGVCFDFGNQVALGECPMTALETLSHRIVAFHLKDVLVVRDHARGGYLWRSVPLGQGTLPLPDMISRINELDPTPPGFLEISTSRPTSYVSEEDDHLAECNIVVNEWPANIGHFADRDASSEDVIRAQELNHVLESLNWVRDFVDRSAVA